MAIKTGQELSDLTADMRAKYLMIREHVIVQDKRFKWLIKALLYTGLVTALNYTIFMWIFNR